MKTSGKYILYADDDSDDQELFEEIMHTLDPDIGVIGVQNGVELFDFFGKLGKGELYPALIVLDLNMPLIGGYQTLRMLKLDPAYAHIPVAIFSTSSQADDKKKAFRYGASEYISKPLYYEELVSVCRNLAEFCKMIPETGR